MNKDVLNQLEVRRLLKLGPIYKVVKINHYTGDPGLRTPFSEKTTTYFKKGHPLMESYNLDFSKILNNLIKAQNQSNQKEWLNDFCFISPKEDFYLIFEKNLDSYMIKTFFRPEDQNRVSEFLSNNHLEKFLNFLKSIELDLVKI